MKKLSAAVAVPHYNSHKTAIDLISRLKEDSFDEIFLLDDDSELGGVSKIQEAHPEISYVIGDKNLGPGGNRNRVLRMVESDVIVFIDADVEVMTERSVADICREYFSNNERQMLGGVVITKDESPMHWNYGHTMHPVNDARFGVLAGLYSAARPGESFRRLIWSELEKHGWDYPWIDSQALTKSRRVDWVSEACFVVRTDDFRAIGGYDESMRYHEGQDLAKRLADSGVEIEMIPDIVVKHLDVDVRGVRRDSDFREGQYRFYEKHWGMTRQIFDKLV